HTKFRTGSGVQHLHAARIASSRFQLRTTGTGMATRLAVAALSVSTLLGCASAKLGDKSTEAELKRFEVAPGRVSLYVCREDTMNGGGIGTEVFVNGKSAGALKPNTFAHALVEPGEVQIFLRRNGLNHNAGDSGNDALDEIAVGMHGWRLSEERRERRWRRYCGSDS
ncbi:DUF2846 domain-containing protein, partial [Ideonella sakaiensis]|uniref:DUF2846 domain-containing protein n=1 Tax=Piscinibacter sakaiensis TaxID=1547922 RepID=UPI001E452B7A